MLKPGKKQSVLHSWGLSYALLLIIPIVMAVVNHAYAYATMREAVETAHKALNESLRVSLDQRVEQLNYSFTRTYLSNEFVMLSSAESRATLASASYNMRILLNQDSVAHADDRRSTILYLPEYDHILSEHNAYASEGVHRLLSELYATDISYEDWLKLLMVDGDKPIYSFSPYLGYSTQASECIVLSKRLPCDFGYIYCHFSISIEKELEQIAAMQKDSLFCVQDSETDALLGAWNARGERIEADSLRFSGALAVLGSEEYAAVSADSHKLAWRFVTLAPTSVFTQKLTQLNRFDLTTLLLTCVACALMALTFLKRNYLPLARILGTIGAEPLGGNEYERILMAYRALSSENTSMRSALSQNDCYAREKYLLSKLLGRDNRFTDWQIERRVEDFFRNRAIRMLAIRAVEASTQMAFDAMQLALDALISPLVINTYDIQRVVDGEKIVYLCVEKEGSEPEAAKLSHIANQLSGAYREKTGEALILVVGDECALADCDKTYSEVSDVVDCLGASGEAGVFQACDLLDADASYRKGRSIAESRLREAVLAGDGAAAAASLKALYAAISQKSTLPFHITRFFYLDIIRQIGGASDEALDGDGRSLEDARIRMGEIALCGDQSAMEAAIDAFARDMCDAVLASRISLSQGTAAHVRDYIDWNYADPNLNLSVVALHMRLSPQTVTQYFRDEMQLSVPDYIAHVRIAHAQKLAGEKNMSVEEIALAVGYGNARTFHRACVRLKGLPPGKLLYPNR